MSSSSRSHDGPVRCDPALLDRFTRHDAHPFQAPEDGAAGEQCSLCGESRAQIRHHPTRIRASCLLKGLDPEVVLGRNRR